MNSILNITEHIPSDTSIDRYEDIEYEPVTGTKLNNHGGDIRLIIETQGIFTHPSKSYLIIEAHLTKANNNSYGENDLIALMNNTMMHLFRSIQYQLSGQEIERRNYPGEATTMLGLLKYPDDFAKSKGLNQLWYKDTLTTAVADNVGWNIRRNYIIKNSDPRGSICFKIPLKHIFGFCEDYDMVVVTTLSLISKISWFMPHVTPADKDKMELYKIIERKVKLPVGYRMIQCDTAASFSWRLSNKSSPEVME